MYQARTRPDAPAIREKNLGIWRTFSWRDYADQVRDLALGLKSLGFGPGDKLCVIGDNRPRLYWAQIAVMSLGGVAVPVYQDAIATELAFVLGNADVVAVVAEDQEQVDKILAIRDKLPNLRLLIFDDPRGLADYDADILFAFERVQALGAASRTDHPDTFATLVESVRGEDIALLTYTSGTTGSPKGVMLSHANLVKSAEIFVAHENMAAGDDLLSYLPLAWVGETMYGMTVSLLVGCACNCPEGPETVQRDLREIGPTGFLAAPRVWETMVSSIQVKAADASPLKSWIFRTFRDAAQRAESRAAAGEAIPFGLKIATWLGEYLVYGPVRDQFGLRRARWCYTGGAPLGPETFGLFRAFGINLKQVYGSTEISGLVSLQKDGEANPNNVGRPCPGIEVALADSGEVLVRSPGVFQGYYKNGAATAEVLDSDGWFHTGDAGIIEPSGHLTIIDRANDVGRLVDGTPFAPQFVENKLKFSPYVSEAVSFGHDKPYVSAMIAIDYDTVGSWAERRGLAYTNYMDLSGKPVVLDLLRDEVLRINQSLPEASRVKRFLLLAKDLDADDEEITRTRKLRRGFIAEKYQSVIDALYHDDDEDVALTTEVTFEDGRKVMLETTLRILEAA
jgi:long-chain acyl-CoA synthetase